MHRRRQGSEAGSQATRPPVLFPGLQKQLGPETWLISQDTDAWYPQPSPLAQLNGQFVQTPIQSACHVHSLCPEWQLAFGGGHGDGGPPGSGSGGSSLGGEAVPTLATCWLDMGKWLTISIADNAAQR